MIEHLGAFGRAATDHHGLSRRERGSGVGPCAARLGHLFARLERVRIGGIVYVDRVERVALRERALGTARQ
jgi:hypothetical protein